MVDFSIICSTRNRAETLKRSLVHTRRVLGARVPIIVFDDASDDPNAVADVAASIANTKVLRSATQVGPGSGRNACLRAAETEFCFSLDDDCYLKSPPDLSRWLKNRTEDQQIAAICFRYFNPVDNFFGPASDIPGVANSLLGGASLLRRDAILRAGGYLEWLVFGQEDSELAARLRSLGYYVWYDPSVIVYHEHVQVARDHDWASFYYIRNAYLISLLHDGVFWGFFLGLIKAFRRGLLHPSWETRKLQTGRAIFAGLIKTRFCLKERRLLFSDERRFSLEGAEKQSYIKNKA